MKRYAIVRYKSETARGSVFRDLARREHYVYVQPNGPENYDDMKTADVIWFDDKDDAVAAADWLDQDVVVDTARCDASVRLKDRHSLDIERVTLHPGKQWQDDEVDFPQVGSVVRPVRKEVIDRAARALNILR